MTSSNGNIFRVTGPLCGEFTGPGEFPTQKPVTLSFDVFFDLHLNKRLSKQSWGWWFKTPSWSFWRQCNVQMAAVIRAHSELGEYLEFSFWLLTHSNQYLDAIVLCVYHALRFGLAYEDCSWGMLGRKVILLRVEAAYKTGRGVIIHFEYAGFIILYASENLSEIMGSSSMFSTQNCQFVSLNGQCWSWGFQSKFQLDAWWIWTIANGGLSNRGSVL